MLLPLSGDPGDGRCRGAAATNPGHRDLAGDVPPTVVLLSHVEVVSATTQSQVLDARRAPQREWFEVVQLELVTRVAAMTAAADERTPTIIAPPHLVPHRHRNIPAARWRCLRR